MIDCHCHFLNSIDDGPTTLSESLQLAKLAINNGITFSVMTPHIHPGRYENQKANINQAVENFQLELNKNAIPLKLGAAAEVRIGPEILTMVQQDAIPYLGELDGYKILLLEFPHEMIPIGSENLVDWLLKRKIRPMITHPERNKDVQRDIERLIPFTERGCLLQLTAASVAGNFGAAAHDASLYMLNQGWVHVIATDAHNVKHRPPDLAAGRDAAVAIIGPEQAMKLVQDNPKKILGL